jgi:hypothetical protein
MLYRNNANYVNLSTSITPLVCNVVQSKVSSDDDILSILDYMDENLSEVESSDSDNETSDNQESEHKNGTSVNTVMGKGSNCHWMACEMTNENLAPGNPQ